MLQEARQSHSRFYSDLERGNRFVNRIYQLEFAQACEPDAGIGSNESSDYRFVGKNSQKHPYNNKKENKLQNKT